MSARPSGPWTTSVNAKWHASEDLICARMRSRRHMITPHMEQRALTPRWVRMCLVMLPLCTVLEQVPHVQLVSALSGPVIPCTKRRWAEIAVVVPSTNNAQGSSCNLHSYTITGWPVCCTWTRVSGARWMISRDIYAVVGGIDGCAILQVSNQMFGDKVQHTRKLRVKEPRIYRVESWVIWHFLLVILYKSSVREHHSLRHLSVQDGTRWIPPPELSCKGTLIGRWTSTVRHGNWGGRWRSKFPAFS
jgi:hypothetical protein